MGKLLVAGDNRYLSDDLLRLVAYMVKQSVGKGAAYHRLEQEFISGNFMYAPQPSYEKSDYYTILRSPHIARNEEVLLNKQNTISNETNEEDIELSLRKVYDFAITSPIEELAFILETRNLNKKAAERSFKIP